MSIGERIKELRTKKGLTLQQVGDAFGITRASVAGWERGDSRPDQEKLSTLAELFGTSVEYLLFGSHTVVRTIPGNPSQSMSVVPLIEWDQIKVFLDDITRSKLAYEQTLVCPKRIGNGSFALKVIGTAMLPRYWPGDYIFIDPSKGIGDGEYAVVIDTHENVPMLRRVISEEGITYLKCINENWPGEKFIKVTGDRYFFVGMVAGIWVEN